MSELEEAALSDFEDEELEATPVVLPASSESPEVAKSDRRKEEVEELKRKLVAALENVEQVSRQRDEGMKMLEMAVRQKEEAMKAREQSRSEIEAAAKLLIAGAEKLTSLVGDTKGFTGGVQRSPKLTGIAALCHGFCVRSEEILEEALKQRDSAVKSRNEAREQMEQRNYEIAIEVSKLESTIASKRDELEKTLVEVHRLAGENTSIRQEFQEKLARRVSEAEMLKRKCESTETTVRTLESELQKMKLKLVDQMKRCLATEESVASLVHKFDGKAGKAVAELPFADFSDGEKVHEEYLRRVSSISDLLVHMKNSWEEKEESRLKERNNLEKEVQRFTQRENEMVNFIRHSLAQNGTTTPQEDDMQALVSVLDAELRGMRLKALDLEKQLADARAEVEKMKEISALQVKDIAAKASRIHELEVRNGLASENAEGLNAEIAAAEEELERWKQAATDEAAAGIAILKEVEKSNQEITDLNKYVVQLRQSLQETRSKLQSKEDIAESAMTALNAAERSLKLADEKALGLRERMEEMSREMEEMEFQKGKDRLCGGKLLEVFPWLRGTIGGWGRQPAVSSAEMEELTAPLV